MPKKIKEQLSDVLKALQSTRNLPESVIRDVLTEAMEKAYRKHCGFSEAELPLRTVFENGKVSIYRPKTVVSKVEDEEFEISVPDARLIDPAAKVGDTVEVEASFDRFERSDIQLAKNVIKQKIKEAERAMVYEKYIDKVGDLVTGIVDTVEDKFCLVHLGCTPEGKQQPGSTMAMMKRSAQIPTEHYEEGQLLKVDIASVDKEAKGPIVFVSRSDPNFIKRLFEKEVPEIYNGEIEIKAIARDPGLRAKMAVSSRNENIDPIGACIGPKGSRVQAIISELNGEKIDIFEWSDDLQKLISNALSPAQGVQVFPAEKAAGLIDTSKPYRAQRDSKPREEKKSLVAAVPENQLSLAIGKKGQNAKLAFRLSGYRIDIRSQEELDEKGIDWRTYVQEMHDEYEEKKAQERAYKQRMRIAELKSASEEEIGIDDVGFTFNEDGFDDQHLEGLETLADKETPASEAADLKNADEMEEAARIAKEKRKSLSERRSQYVSRFEAPEPVKPAASKEESKERAGKESRKEESRRPEKKKPSFDVMHPIYTEDELKEIEENEIEDEMNASWNDDVDYEEYDSYYDDEY